MFGHAIPPAFHRNIHKMDCGMNFRIELQDVIHSNFTPAWGVLRRLTHVAMRKYALSNKLAELVADIIDRDIEDLLNDQEAKTSGVVEFIEAALASVLAISTAGDRSATSNEKLRSANLKPMLRQQSTSR